WSRLSACLRMTQDLYCEDCPARNIVTRPERPDLRGSKSISGTISVLLQLPPPTPGFSTLSTWSIRGGQSGGSLLSGGGISAMVHLCVTEGRALLNNGTGDQRPASLDHVPGVLDELRLSLFGGEIGAAGEQIRRSLVFAGAEQAFTDAQADQRAVGGKCQVILIEFCRAGEIAFQ